MKKLTIEEMQRLAKSKNGKCLSKRYVNIRTPLKWECEKGHQWKALPSSIKQGHWCRICAYEKRAYSIKDMQQLAAISGGQCLSKEYVNIVTRLTFKCEKGHVWSTTPTSILHGHWCPECVGKAKGTIEQMRGLARSRGGKCLSREYLDERTRLSWKCSKGHKWWTAPHNIKRGMWCPVCAGNRKKTIEEMQKMAKPKGGKCLSKEYVNNQTKLLWECRGGHRWWAGPKHILEGRWCIECKREERRKSRLKELRGIAKSRSGKYLSESYVDSQTRLKWECSKGHRWLATSRNIKQGTWCPHCRKGSKQ